MTFEERSKGDESPAEAAPPSQPPFPPPPPPTIERYYYISDSPPLMTGGEGRACKERLNFHIDSRFDDDSPTKCNSCGAMTPRLEAIRGRLAALDMIVWSLFSSDKYVNDSFTMTPGSIVSYKGTFDSIKFEKWLRHDAWLYSNPENRYQPNPLFLGGDPPVIYFLLRDSWPGNAVPDPLPEVGFSWFRYGLTSLGAVPAWRQALFGAVTLVDTNPSAAVVLIAAGFEAFFLETMRIGWQEQGLDMGAFARLDRNTLTTLVEWLPAAVRVPSLVDAPNDLHGRWRRLVNQRRNEVVHRADVHVTSEQAQESLNVALEAITFLDPFALTRPHAYYVGR